MSAPDPIGLFQGAVMLALSEGQPVAEVITAATLAAPDAPFEAWIASWDGELVLLASELVQKWAHEAG